MSLTIPLPSYLSARSIRNSVFTCHNIHNAEENIILDASNLRFVDPFGITLLGSSLHDAFSWGLGVKISGLREDVGTYLQRMDLFQGVEFIDCQPFKGTRRNRRDSLVELFKLDKVSQVDDVAHRLASALVGRFPGVDPNEEQDQMSGFRTIDRYIEPIQYSLCELLENALTHARRHYRKSASVWVCGQYYPTRNRVRLGVTDDGCGFLATLRGHPELDNETHLEAILTALKPRVSCNRDLGIRNDSVNQGVGLTTVMRIAQHTRGKAVIVSGNAFHDTERKSGVFSEEIQWNGVGVALEFQRDFLLNTDFRKLLPPAEGGQEVTLRFE